MAEQARRRKRKRAAQPVAGTQPITNFFKTKQSRDQEMAALPTEDPAPETVALPLVRLKRLIWLEPGDGARDGPSAGGGSAGVRGGLNTGARVVSSGVVSDGVVSNDFLPVVVLKPLPTSMLHMWTRSSRSQSAPSDSLSGAGERSASGTTRTLMSDHDGSGGGSADRGDTRQTSAGTDDSGHNDDDDGSDDEVSVEIPEVMWLSRRTLRQKPASPESTVLERFNDIAEQLQRAKTAMALQPPCPPLVQLLHTSDEDGTYNDEVVIEQLELLKVSTSPRSALYAAEASTYSTYTIPDYPPGEPLLDTLRTRHGEPFASIPLRPDGGSDAPLGAMLRRGAGLPELVCLIRCRLIPVQWEQAWLFRVMVMVDSDLEADLARGALWEICSQSHGRSVWVPSLLEFVWALVMLGVPYSAIFPHPDLAPNVTDHSLLLGSVSPVDAADPAAAPVLAQDRTVAPSQLLRLSMPLQVLAGCLSACPSAYSDVDRLLLVSAIARLNLDPVLQSLNSDFQRLLHVALGGAWGSWPEQIPRLCHSLSRQSSHHHNLVNLVQSLPSYEPRCRQLQRYLCLVVIGELLKEPGLSLALDEDGSNDGVKVSLLLPLLPRMMWRSLLERLQTEEREAMQLGGTSDDQMKQNVEACYLSYSLLTLVDVYIRGLHLTLAQRKPLLRLLELLRRLQNGVQESPQHLYRSKLKNLIWYITHRWQDLLRSIESVQSKLYDFWNTDELSDEEVWDQKELGEEV